MKNNLVPNLNLLKKQILVFAISGLIVFAFIIFSFSSCAKTTAKKAKPNILFILTDDLAFDALSYFGSQVQTTHMDSIAKRGTVFTTTYIPGSFNAAVCLPNRIMLNTGVSLLKSADVHKQKTGLGKKASYIFPKENLWGNLFRKAGYQTFFTGKWHVESKIQPEHTFDFYTNVQEPMPQDYAKPNALSYYRPVKGKKDIWTPWLKKRADGAEGYWRGGKHWSEVIADDAENFFAISAKSDKPFFMYLGFNAPHDPRQSPQSYVDKYPPKSIKLPPNFMKEYPYSKPMGAYRIRGEMLAPYPRTEYSMKTHISEYYAIIHHLDDQIGRILDALKKSGKEDNTYIILTSDNGLAMGSHSLMAKQSMYDHCLRVPFFVVGPSIPSGKEISTPIYMQDVYPTALEMAGVKQPKTGFYKSIMPLIEGKRKQNYSEVYAGYKKLQAMVFDRRYKLIYYNRANKYRLFDLQADPYEINDIADLPNYAKIKAKLQKKLTAYQKNILASRNF